MRCNNCGCEFDEGCFCPECGTNVEEVIETKNMGELEKTHANIEMITENDTYAKELEKERINLERAKIEKERLEIEENNRRIQKEMQKAKEEEEKRQAEIDSRTYKGTVYSSVEEMKVAKVEGEKIKEQKKVDALAIWCFVLSLLPFTIIGAYFFWATGIAALVLGILALRGKTRKKGFAIAGIVIDGLMLLLMIIVVIFCIINYA